MNDKKLFPSIKPYKSGYLKVKSGHSIYWEISGNPDSIPLLFLHGGPGASCHPIYRRFFNPNKFKIILFDQRGCGFSYPYADIQNNNTQLLIEDIELLRTYLSINKWVLFGGSWGSTLALLYAEKYPEKVISMILRGIFFGTKEEIEWFIIGMRTIFPESWNKFSSQVNLKNTNSVQKLLSAYKLLLHNPDPKVHIPAAFSWTNYENECANFNTKSDKVLSEDHKKALALARIENHYFLNDMFLKPFEILNNAKELAEIPGYIIQGRYDVICPPSNAYKLSEVWKKSKLKIVEKAGHSSLESGVIENLIHATNSIGKYLSK